MIHVICFGSTLLCDMIGLKSLWHFVIQSGSNLTKTNRFHALYVKLELHVFMSSFDWFTKLSVSFVTGQRQCLWFWFDERKSDFSLAE